ncbi:MAG: hypothetical protein COV76_07210 [Candidatus Omnitrophica bacterium CG11_big_fil_rev_8_21_14_0_20_64_10]|nr:MAG: hypothetical protein COV76_07210 [Candidatus Omnitrophica bacterium CG11_big_fil_rev_8_21_14_0_20_64_10]
MGIVWMLTAACGLLAGRFHHTVGIAPVLGVILCAACFLKPRQLFWIGWGGMLLRDGLVGFSPFTLVRLLAITAVVAAVVRLRLRPTFRSLAVGLLLVSPVYHGLLTVGDWWTGTCVVLPRTAEGLARAFATALPYLGRAFVGDLLFTSVFLALCTMAAYAAAGRRPLALVPRKVR